MTEEQKRALVEAARAVIDNAYAPYSGFDVGAAILDEQGRIHTGVNVENAVFPVGVCAERSAICVAVSAGAKNVVALALVTRTPEPACPCGMCRQALAEFNPSLPMFLATEAGPWVERNLSDVLPFQFDGALLPGKKQ
jgi:cytidine deaminase